MRDRAWLNGCPENERSMTVWEYTVTPLLLHQEARILNNWGGDGWELVTVQQGPQGGLIAFLKRPVPSAASTEEH